MRSRSLRKIDKVSQCFISVFLKLVYLRRDSLVINDVTSSDYGYRRVETDAAIKYLRSSSRGRSDGTSEEIGDRRVETDVSTTCTLRRGNT
jgi:hypothetical protein